MCSDEDGLVAACDATRATTAPGREPGTRELPSARRQRPRANSQAAGKLPVAGAREGASSASKLQKDQVHGKSSRQQENANEKEKRALSAPAQLNRLEVLWSYPRKYPSARTTTEGAGRA